jgi:hypothetical protein
VRQVDDEVLLFEMVAVVDAIRARDFDEARFRCQQIGNCERSEAKSRISNAAITLEFALRYPGHLTTMTYEPALEALIREVNAFLRPRWAQLLSTSHQMDGG